MFCSAVGRKLFMRKHDDDPRTEEQIREHYELEKQLAARLKNSTHE